MTHADEITRKVPDYAETRLGFRTFRIDRARNVLLSVNAGQTVKKPTWIASVISLPEGEWPPGERMVGRCLQNREHVDGVPDPECRCGIHATTDLEVVNDYLTQRSPVVGIVELGGRTIPATQGYRAQAARVAAVLLVDEMLTLPHGALRKVAERYQVPALVPTPRTPTTTARRFTNPASVPSTGTSSTVFLTRVDCQR